MSTNLAERRAWFRHFPEGTIEFTIVTRVLAILLLGVIMIVSSAQRHHALTALVAVLWLDYALTLWWLIQLSRDLDDLFEQPDLDAGAARKRRLVLLGMLIVPSVLAALILAPQTQALLTRAGGKVLLPVLGVVYLAAVGFARRALLRLNLVSGLHAVLLFVPVVHWFALHAAVVRLHGRIRERALSRGFAVSDETGRGAASIAADVLLGGGIVFWGLWILLTLARGGAMTGPLPTLVELVGIFFAALFAVVDVAVMEALQRRFSALIKRL